MYVPGAPNVRRDTTVNALLICIAGMLGSRVAVGVSASTRPSLQVTVVARSADRSPGAVTVQVAAAGAPTTAVAGRPIACLRHATSAVGKKLTPWTVNRPPATDRRVVKSA